jgi:hypothetical protein
MLAGVWLTQARMATLAHRRLPAHNRAVTTTAETW